MKLVDREALSQKIEAALMRFHDEDLPLPGIVPVENRLSAIAQIVDSLRRIEYVTVIRDQAQSPLRADPAATIFDPLRAALLKASEGDLEEACWLVFLATHCGKNLRTGWKLSAELYEGGAAGPSWTWAKVKADPGAFGTWLNQTRPTLVGKFGNHRKYESLRDTGLGTAAVVTSYVEWIASPGSHAALFAEAEAQSAGSPRRAFSYLYRTMSQVKRFGRTGRFDFLTMLSKLGLANIDADATYMNGATGPLRGARLLFTGQIDSRIGAPVLEQKLQRLESKVGWGMQVLEDSLCNWQKSPNLYIPFHG